MFQALGADLILISDGKIHQQFSARNPYLKGLDYGLNTSASGHHVYYTGDVPSAKLKLGEASSWKVFLYIM